MNQLFSMRYPSVTITSFMAQLISYPVRCFFRKSIANNEGPDLWLGVAIQSKSSLQYQRTCGDYNNVEPQF